MESRWVVYSNFVLFGLLFLALLYSVVLSLHDASHETLRTPADDHFETESSYYEPAPRRPLLMRLNTGIASDEYRQVLAGVADRTRAIPVHEWLESRMRRYAQVSALASYCIAPCLRNWTVCLDHLDTTINTTMMLRNMRILAHFSTYGHNHLQGGEGILALETQPQTGRHVLVVGFGGSTVASDWINDFSAWSVPYTGIMDSVHAHHHPRRRSSPFDAVHHRPRVHAGVFGVYNRLRPLVIDAIQQALHQHAAHVTEIVTTGHSLGGALAHLLMMDLRQIQLHPSPSLPHIDTSVYMSIYTYGQPRISNQALIQYTSTLFSARSPTPVRQFRIAHQFDVVPLLPPKFLGYVHDEQRPTYYLHTTTTTTATALATHDHSETAGGFEEYETWRCSRNETDVDDETPTDVPTNLRQWHHLKHALRVQSTLNDDDDSRSSSTHDSAETLPDVVSHPLEDLDDDDEEDLAQDTKLSKCGFKGWTKRGHVSYYWDLDEVKLSCRAMDQLIPR